MAATGVDNEQRFSGLHCVRGGHQGLGGLTPTQAPVTALLTTS